MRFSTRDLEKLYDKHIVGEVKYAFEDLSEVDVERVIKLGRLCCLMGYKVCKEVKDESRIN